MHEIYEWACPRTLVVFNQWGASARSLRLEETDHFLPLLALSLVMVQTPQPCSFTPWPHFSNGPLFKRPQMILFWVCHLFPAGVWADSVIN